MLNKQPDQQIHDELIKRSVLLGLPAFLFLPDDSESYPFTVMVYAQVIPQPIKTKLIGEVVIQCDVWDSTDDRELVSNWVGKLTEGFSNVRQINGR